MDTNNSYTFTPDAFYIMLLKSAIAFVTLFLAKKPTAFAGLIDDSGLIDSALLAKLSARLKKANQEEEFRMSLDEMLLLYTCSYITASFAQNSDAFYDWYTALKEPDMENSSNYREALFGAQLKVMENVESLLDGNSQARKLRQQLLNTFGIIENPYW